MRFYGFLVRLKQFLQITLPFGSQIPSMTQIPPSPGQNDQDRIFWLASLHPVDSLHSAQCASQDLRLATPGPFKISPQPPKERRIKGGPGPWMKSRYPGSVTDSLRKNPGSRNCLASPFRGEFSPLNKNRSRLESSPSGSRFARKASRSTTQLPPIPPACPFVPTRWRRVPDCLGCPSARASLIHVLGWPPRGAPAGEEKIGQAPRSVEENRAAASAPPRVYRWWGGRRSSLAACHKGTQSWCPLLLAGLIGWAQLRLTALPQAAGRAAERRVFLGGRKCQASERCELRASRGQDFVFTCCLNSFAQTYMQKVYAFVVPKGREDLTCKRWSKSAT